MRKSILQALSAVALIAASAAPAFAGTIQGANVDLIFSDAFVPVSHTGNSFTFSSGPNVEDGVPNNAAFESGFIIDAHAGQALTGKLSFTMEVQYQLEAPPTPWPYDGPYNGSVLATIDVLSPNCDTCGPFDSKLIGVASDGASASSSSPTAGTWNLSSNVTEASGSYSNLIAYMFHDYYLNPAYGSMNVTSFALSFDTVPVSSPVPELPPVGMLSLGLVALAMRARFLKERRAGKHAALDA